MNGEDALVTVLFVDIRDFTPFADRSTAREAVALLNEFFGVVVPVLEEHGGRVQAFLGDGMLGVFGAPEPLPDHADRGVAAAREIVASVEAHFGDRCRVSVGVNSGLVIVGTIGGGSRFELGIIGDPVNVAARVEQATRRTGDSVLVTEATRCLLERDGLVPRGAIELKGKPAPVPSTRWGRRRDAGALAWLLAVVLTAPGTGANAMLDYPDAFDLVADVRFLALGLGAATTGALVTTRVPGNAVGRILLALGVGIGSSIACGAYAQVAPRPRPARCPPSAGWPGSATGPASRSLVRLARRSCSCCSRTGTSCRRAGAPLAWFMGDRRGARDRRRRAAPGRTSRGSPTRSALVARPPTFVRAVGTRHRCARAAGAAPRRGRAGGALAALARRRAAAAQVVHLRRVAGRRRARPHVP